MHLKKMALLGMCADSADPISDNGLHRVLLGSLQRGDDADGAGSRAGSEHEDDDEATSQRSSSRKVRMHEIKRSGERSKLRGGEGERGQEVGEGEREKEGSAGGSGCRE